jgi:hypothetical protein
MRDSNLNEYALMPCVQSPARTLRRYDIVKGDATTVGGVVQGGDASDVI